MRFKLKKTGAFSPAAFLLEAAVVLSVFSQITPITSFIRPAMYAMWLAVIFVNIIKNRGRIHITAFTQRFLISYGLFIVFCVLVGLFHQNHLRVNYIHVLFVPLLMTVAADFYINDNSGLFNRAGKLYCISAVIFALWVQLRYFSSYSSWLRAEMYVYSSKNSGGQIWVAAILIALCFLEYKTTVEKVLFYIGSAYLLFLTAMSQCRTSLLGLLIAVVAYSVFRSPHKTRWLLAIAVALTVIWIIPVTRQFMEQALFLKKYEGADLNTFSSGRLGYYENAMHRFLSSPLIGNGVSYVDCSYISILMESGIIGFILIEWIWMKKLVMCFQFRGEQNKRMFLFLITVFYIVESLLEGYPPFGPGVSAFMFWLISEKIIYSHQQSRILE